MIGAEADPPIQATEAVEHMHRSQWNSLESKNIRIMWIAKTAIPYTTHIGAATRSTKVAVDASKATMAYR